MPTLESVNARKKGSPLQSSPKNVVVFPCDGCGGLFSVVLLRVFPVPFSYAFVCSDSCGVVASSKLGERFRKSLGFR